MVKTFVCMAAMGIACGLASSAFAEDPYVESDGTQAVVLDYFVNPKTKIVADFAFQAPLTRQWRLFGVEGSSAVFACLYISNGDVYSWSWKNSSGNYTWTYVRVTTDRRTITLDGPNKKIQVAKDGNVETNLTMSAVTATATYPLGLFCDVTDASGTVVANKCKAKIYSFKIYENDELVMDLEPWHGTDGSYALKDVVGGKVYLPMTGNPLAGGGDIVHTSDAYTWTGAESSAWNAAANWQVAGSAALRPPQTGDDVAIAAGSTVDIGDIVGTASTLALAGNGTVALTGTQPRNLAALLTVASGTTLSLAADTTLRVPAATYGGAPVADGRYAAGALPWLAGSGMLVVGNPGATVEDGTLILDVPQGQTLAYYTQLASPITKIVKLGAGTAIVSNDNNSAWVGTVDVKEGILEAQSGVTGTATIPVFGRNAANTITVFKGAQLLARIRSGNSQTDQRFQNNLVIAGDGPDGYGAVRLVRTGGSTHLDRLFTNVTLSDDASVLGSHRLGFASGTVNLNGHTLTHRPIATGSTEFMMYNSTMKGGHVHAKNGSQTVAQGNSVKFQGTADNTLTIDSGANFSMWNVTFSQFDWTTILKGGSWLRAASGGTSSTANRILGPVVLDGGTVIVTNYSPATVAALNLNGPVSGTGKMFQNGIMNTYLRSTSNVWKGGLEVKSGTVWAQETGSLPPVGPLRASGSGAINFVAKNWDLATLHNTLTNWDGNGAVNVYTAAGETLTDNVDIEHATYYRHGGPGTLVFTADTTPDGATRLYNGEGEMVVAGNKTRRLTRLNVTGGTMTLENAGYIWCGTWDVANDAPKANSSWTVGGTNTNAPAKMVVKAGTTLDALVPSGNNTASYFAVQDTGTKGAILEIHGGAVTNWIGVGYNANARGALYQYGGEVRNLCHAGYDGYVGRYATSYGHVDLMGGLLAMRGWWRFGGEPGAVGMMRMSGGTFKADNCMVLSFGGWGELYMTGGTYNGGTYSHLGEQQYGLKGGEGDTIRGLLTLGGDGNPMFTITSYLNVCERTNTFFGAVNMNAGVLSTPLLQKSSWNKSLRDNEVARAFINFGGGAWQAYTGNANIFGSGVQRVNRVTVFPGGATLDINGKSSSNGAVPFEKPFGKGVASIAWPAGTSTNNYIGPPEVYIAGGGGTGAVAHCTFDARTGTIGEIVVASPGWGYTGAPTATIKSADRKTTITCAVTLTDGEEQPGGGLTLTNSSVTAGTFTLSAANTYTGATVVAGGTLKLGAADAIPSANEVRLAGGTFDAASYDISYARVGGYGTLKGNVTVTDKLVFDAAQPPTQGLTVSGGSLTLGSGVTVEIANTNLLTRGTTHTLATSTTPFPSGLQSNLPKPWCVFLTNGGKTLKMHYQAATMVLVK